MQASLLRGLRRHRSAMHARWDALLHAEPVTSPLALPDTLVHLIDATLDEVFFALMTSDAPFEPPRARLAARPRCPCGRNPYLAYFSAGEQALREGLVLAQAALLTLDAAVRDSSLAELDSVLHRISRREIETFCGVCQYRVAASGELVQPVPINGG